MIRKVSFIDPNDGELTYGLLNADNTAYRILCDEFAQRLVALNNGPLYTVANDLGKGALGLALFAMIAANPV